MEINPSIVICALCGIIYLITGKLMQLYPPKKINDFYGYRTSKSKKSQEHWDFAQIESAKHLMQAGYYSLLCCTPFIVLEFDKSHVWIAIVLVTLLPFVAIFQTEKALKNNFDL